MKLVTVFTPTYNRAHTLGKCYESLKRQTSGNFLWQIVDDGSTDNTKELVEQFAAEGCMEIRYCYKANGGKVSAINHSLDITDTPLWVCLDSDDYLTDSAVEIMERYYSEIEKRDDICGLFGLRSKPDLSPMQDRNLPDSLEMATQMEIRYKFGIPPEYVQVYKTKIAKQYKYPLFEGERFVPLSYVQDQMDQKYRFYLFREPVMICEYLDDGITRNHRRLVRKNPRGFTAFKKQQMQLVPGFMFRVKACIGYDMGCIMSGNKNWLKESPCKLLSVLCYPAGMAAYFLRYRKA